VVAEGVVVEVVEVEVEEEVAEVDKLWEDKLPQVQDPNCWERNLPTSPEIDETSIDLWPT
jgi:hypothetical protein